MFKHAWIVVLLLSSSALGQSSQSPTPQQSKAATEISSVCQPQTKCEPASAPTETYREKVLRPDVLPVWIGSLAAFFASCAGLYTLKLLREQSRTGLLAAQAAKMSADIAINTERAWLITEVQFASNLPDFAEQGGSVKSAMVVNFINAGRSPAEIDGAHIVTMLCPKSWPLPSEPTYGDDEGDFVVNSMPGEIIPAGQDRHVVSHINRIGLLTDEQISSIRSGERILYCYGKVMYKDSSRNSRVTQFGYSFYIRRGSEDNQPEAMYRLKNTAYNYTD